MYNTEDKTKKVGWICPICKCVYSPTVKTCKTCTQKEMKDSDDKQFLLCEEYLKLLKEGRH